MLKIFHFCCYNSENELCIYSCIFSIYNEISPSIKNQFMVLCAELREIVEAEVHLLEDVDGFLFCGNTP